VEVTLICWQKRDVKYKTSHLEDKMPRKALATVQKEMMNFKLYIGASLH